jgi:hypothetical protein
MYDEGKLRADVQRLCERRGEDIRARTNKILDDWETHNRGMARAGWSFLILLLVTVPLFILLFNLLFPYVMDRVLNRTSSSPVTGIVSPSVNLPRS